jgi:hypothetical protein
LASIARASSAVLNASGAISARASWIRGACVRTLVQSSITCAGVVGPATSAM